MSTVRLLLSDAAASAIIKYGGIFWHKSKHSQICGWSWSEIAACYGITDYCMIRRKQHIHVEYEREGRKKNWEEGENRSKVSEVADSSRDVKHTTDHRQHKKYNNNTMRQLESLKP